MITHGMVFFVVWFFLLYTKGDVLKSIEHTGWWLFCISLLAGFALVVTYICFWWQ